MAILGQKVTAATETTTIVLLASANQRGVVSDDFVAPSPGFLTRVGMYCSSLGPRSFPQVRYAIWRADATGAPTSRLAMTAVVNVPVPPAANAEAGVNNVDPNNSDPAAPVNTAARVRAGERVVPGFAVWINNVSIATLAGAARIHHERTIGDVTSPTNPFNPTASEAIAPIALYVVFDAARAPSVPAGLSPAAGATINTTVPTFSGTFVDADSISPWYDKISEYQVEVRNAATLATIWSGSPATFTATTTERAAAAFTRDYAGPALTVGASYQWRGRVADDVGLWSDWTAWTTFTVNAGGQVDVATGTPSGKVSTDPAALSWTGKWYHPSGLATNRVQVRVWQGATEETAALLKLGAEVTKTVASSASPGTSFTVTSAEAGIGTIGQGLPLFYQLRGRDTANLWSGWSAMRQFSTNSLPTTPTNLQPPSGATSTSYPLLEFNAADPDAEDVEGVDVTFDVEITTPGGVVTVYSTSAYDATRGVASLQTTATHVPATGTYSWRARSVETGAFGSPTPWSAPRTFVYAAGPVVTVTNPTEGETEATTTPIVTWTTSGQQRFLVLLYDTDGTATKKSSGQVTGTVGQYQLPIGWLGNDKGYDLTVTAWNSGNVAGTSLRRRFAIHFDPPVAPTNLLVSPYANALDYEPSSVLVSWDQYPYDPGTFGGYVVRRRTSEQDYAAATILRTITNVGQTRWFDHHPAPGKSLVYSVTQVEKNGGIVMESPPVEAATRIDLSAVVLVSTGDTAKRAVLVYEPARRSGELVRRQAQYTTWGSAGKPTVYVAPGRQRVIQASFTLVTDLVGSVDKYDALDAAVALWESQDTVSYRDDHTRFWGKVTDFKYDIGRASIAVDATIGETDFREGETPKSGG